MITIRRARPDDAAAIGAVHVAAWRSAYPGLLPGDYLAALSPARQAAYAHRAIPGGGVHVASVSGLDLGAADAPAEVVGFVTSGRARGQSALADGEIETIYVLDDWRDRGLGRRLMQAAADHLADLGCQSVFLWVLRDNPSRWFYAALGGRPAQDGTVTVAGQPIAQTAYVWSPLEKLRNACADR